MPTEGEVYAKIYKPGDAVERSGIYRVSHDHQHTEDHEITVVSGRKFPPCRSCGEHPRYKAVRLAMHMERNEYLR